MPSDLYNSILDSLDGQLTLPEDDLATAKAKMEALHGHPIAPDTQAEWTEYGGVRCAVVQAGDVTEGDRYLLYFRGGAFIAADGDGFLFYAEMLSRQLNASVVMVDYALAPAHVFPTVLNQLCDAYQGLLGSGVPAERITFIGDSCGGGLVLTSLLQLRDRGIELPACGISLCGWFDLAADSDHKDPLYRQAYSHKRGLDYAGDADLKNPLISPVFADFHGLPPLLLQAGGVDPTSAHAEIVHRRATQSGVTSTLDIAPEMVHGFHGFTNLGVPESAAALRRARSFMDGHCGPPQAHK
ncbi:MAG: alpha/beta hydrolase fold domain-containing protein [Halieaceae bacterium]|jgi:epsilon-lactone hydrolase|nr:alpha/beta hydrolase fold domain-containing protein [Halieaceae bacterium]